MRKPYCCEGVNKNALSSERSLSVPRIHKESTYAAQEKSPSCERALGHGRPTASHVLSSRTAPDCLSPLSSKVSAIITHPSHPVWDSLAAEQWAVGQTDSVWTVFQAWWTERCWSRWSEATGCRVLRAARSRCTKWCGSAGRKSQTSGPLSSTSSPSSRTTSPPLSHSTSPETTCRDPLRDPETHHHVLISHQDGSQTHCGTSSQQLPCTLVLTEIFGCFCFFLFPPQELNVKTWQHDFCRQAVLCLRMCVWWSWWGRRACERVWSRTTSRSQNSAGLIPCIADRGSCGKISDELNADGWFTVAQNQLFLCFSLPFCLYSFHLNTKSYCKNSLLF